MQLPYSETIDIKYLARLFDKKSESYKLFWFLAIVNMVSDGKSYLTYNELIDEMVADSWYMVTEYRLNLGPSDTLEALVKYIYEISGFKTDEKRDNILSYLNRCNDKKVAAMKRIITQNVPYRLQSPFTEQITESMWKGSRKQLAENINREKRVIYYFTELAGMKTAIKIQPEWCDYISKNKEILIGWVRYNLIMYLQRRNPNVPGIADKLDYPRRRQLNLVIKYWKKIMEIKPVCEIYLNESLTDKNISIDHFVPWSYVTHNELWNLHPTTKRINTRKGNKLPDWYTYFPALCEKEYFSYNMMWEYEAVHEEFEKCSKMHINSYEVFMKLYRPGLGENEFRGNLENILLPVYKSAQNAGFKDWDVKNS